MSSQILCCVWVENARIAFGSRKESVRLPRLWRTENSTISAESLLCLSGRFPKGTRQSSFFEITNMIDLEYHQHPEEIEGRILFHVRVQRRRLDNENNATNCRHNSKKVSEYAAKFPEGHLTFLGRGTEEKWYGTLNSKPDGVWNRSAQGMMLNSAERTSSVQRKQSFGNRCIEK